MPDSSSPDSALNSAFVHSPWRCSGEPGPMARLSEPTGSAKTWVTDQSRTPRVGPGSRTCVQFSSIWSCTFSPTARHISTMTCAIAVWLM